MKIIGVIPARYKSSRFPGKPLVDICGKPMIWWVYQQAKKVPEFDEVYVATDDERIKAASTVKVVTDQRGDAMYFSRSVIPSNVKDGHLARVFRHVGIYAYKRDFLKEFSQMTQTELELGEGIEPLRAMERGYKMRLKETKHSSIGVDLPEHIEKVERVIQGIDTLD